MPRNGSAKAPAETGPSPDSVPPQAPPEGRPPKQRVPYRNQWGQVVGYYEVKASSPSAKTSSKSGTIQIPIKVSKAAQSKTGTGQATPGAAPPTTSFKSGTVQIPNNKSAGIKALMQKPATSALKKIAVVEAAPGVRGSCGACQQDVTDSHERVFSEGSYFHKDCFNTLMDAIDESKRAIREKMQAKTGVGRSAEPYKTVRISKSEAVEIPSIGNDANRVVEKGAVQGEVRGTCPSCQKAVTTEMPRLSVEGTYYHQECHDVMTKALQTAQVQGKARFSSSVSRRVPEPILESPKTPGGGKIPEDESPVSLPPYRAQQAGEELGESRGKCRLCGLDVYSTEDRCKDVSGDYLHKTCFDDLSANGPLPVGQV